MSFCIVFVSATEQPLAVCKSPKAATKYIRKLPNWKDGTYGFEQRSKVAVLGDPLPVYDDTTEGGVVPTQETVVSVLAEARHEGIQELTTGGAYRLAYVALNSGRRKSESLQIPDDTPDGTPIGVGRIQPMRPPLPGDDS